LEPKGVISGTSKVYINPKLSVGKKYNFILNTGFSKVDFLINAGSSKFEVGRLEIANSRFVSLGNNVDVDNLVLDSNLTQLSMRGDIKNSVTINGSNTTSMLYGKIEGNLTVKGNSNIVDVTGNVTGAVSYDCEYGRLTLRADCGKLTVKSKYATLQANSITNDVDIQMAEANGPNITLMFKNGLSNNPKLKIRGYDGNISVGNICGPVDIETKKGAAGFANISLHFAKVYGTNTVVASGYPIGHNTIANIAVDLPSNAGLTLNIYEAWQCYNYFDERTLGNGSYIINNAQNVVLNVTTPSVFTLKKH
jgi:hypothetical protein